MKLPVANSVARVLTGLFMVVFFGVAIGAAGLHAQSDVGATDEPASPHGSTPAAALGDGNANKKPRKNRVVEESSAPPRAKNSKEIPFPLPVGEPASELKIPDTDSMGRLLSQIMAAKATRLDNEHVQMTEMKMDLNHPDGKEDFHVLLPTSVFNLKTRIITSDDAVTVRTQDFELTGEGMEFNTVDRTGKLIGKVKMLIHNFKQVAGQTQPASKPE